MTSSVLEFNVWGQLTRTNTMITSIKSFKMYPQSVVSLC